MNVGALWHLYNWLIASSTGQQFDKSENWQKKIQVLAEITLKALKLEGLIE